MKVLLVPSIRASMGSAHLKRVLRLSEIFGPDSAVLLEDLDQALDSSRGNPGSEREKAGSDPKKPDSGLEALLRPLGIEYSAYRFLERLDPQEPWDLVIVDRRSSTERQIRRFCPAPVVGLDEGGSGRRYCSYLVDTFPIAGRRHRSNLSTLSLLDLPARRTRNHFPINTVLISFGGEDPADLSGRLLELLLRKRFFPREKITVVQGPYFKRDSWPKTLKVLRNPEDLKSMLGGYDLLFCAFGLTTYEGLAAGLPVVNLNPTRYHRRLSRAGGIPEIGVRRPSARKLESLLDRPEVLEDLLARHPPETFSGPPRLSELPSRLQPSGSADCPLCGQTAIAAVARFPERSYFRCRSCGILYLIAFGPRSAPAAQYDARYFLSEYRKQYGKTYLEDFQTIKGMAAERLRHIGSIAARSGFPVAPIRRPATAPKPAAKRRNTAPVESRTATPAPSPAPPPRLLDVGCAYGPFLQAAAEQGYRVQGLDVSLEAVRYVRDHLGISCTLGDFSSDDSSWNITATESGFDVITMWYVIEHFRDPATVLRRVNRLLAPGGVFAFSTPSGSGISARRNQLQFLENSPADHFTVWSPRRTAGILRRFGLKQGRIVVTGHHGERFPWCGRLTTESGITSGFSALSRLLRLGDTFEAYAVKVKDLP